jgi:hypothetical protein
MTSEETAWLAGIMDGEGCISWSDYKKRGKTTAHITIAMSDRDIIYRIQKIVPEGRIHRVSKKTAGGKTMYHWRLNKREAVVDLLKKTLPWLSRRRTIKAKEVIKNISPYIGKRNGDKYRATTEKCYHGHTRTPENTRTNKKGILVCLECKRTVYDKGKCR